MSNLVQTTSVILPLQPRVGVKVRLATMADLPFIDGLQKRTSKQVGFMPTKQFEGKINAGHVLIAEARTEQRGLRTEERGRSRTEVRGLSAESLSTQSSALITQSCIPTQSSSLSPQHHLGYLIGRDQYFKRDDVGVIYQINVAPQYRRSLVAAALLKAQFERSAYGCRLYCCWCAQDIDANRFWEAMGFVPLAFRAGSREKGRVHIFWQRRIRSGDTSTPWWFPSQTNSGAIREDRLVLPIPPGTHWSEVRGVLLPNADCELPIEKTRTAAPRRERGPANRQSQITNRQSIKTIHRGGLRFGAVVAAQAAPAKPKREPRPKVKHDPRHVAAARELRDRYLEHVNAGGEMLLAQGKYDVSRMIDGPRAVGPALAALPAAA